MELLHLLIHKTKMKKKSLLIIIITFCTINSMSARAKIPFGKIDKIQIVADLPNTKEFESKEGSNEFLDLGRLHQEYNIAWVIPAWITVEPKLVLTKKDSEEYFEISDEQLDQIIKANKLNKNDLLKLDFFTRYGGKIILLLIISLIAYGIFAKDKNKDVKPTTI